MCSKSLKTRLIFRERKHERHIRLTERNPTVHDRGNGKTSGEIREESGQGLHPASVTDAARIDQTYPDYGRKSVWKGLLGYFQNQIDTPSASAFVQQRKKLLPSACSDVFRRFTDFLAPQKSFRGCRVLAVDCTSLKFTSYPKDAGAYRPGTERQHGWNLYHVNALFDLEDGIYTDVLVQKEHTKNEDKSLCEMAEHSTVFGPLILLADRGYEAYNNFAHLERKGWKYLIHLKDRNRTYAYGITLPDQPEFDLPVLLTLERLTQRQLKQRGILVPEGYCRLPNNVPFDYLDHNTADFYFFSARIVRLKLKDGSTETIITNLDHTSFLPPFSN